MTNQELINILQTLPPDALVRIETQDDTYDINQVRLSAGGQMVLIVADND